MTLFLKNLLFTLVVPGSVAVFAPLLLTRVQPPVAGWGRLLSVPLFAIALALYLWSVWSFASRGKGTPLPIDAPKRLVLTGPYLHIRNPMYVAVMSALLGWLVAYRTPALLLYAFGAGAAFAGFVIWYEEPHLKRTFGGEYDRYRNTVPRWLPRRRRTPGT